MAGRGTGALPEPARVGQNERRLPREAQELQVGQPAVERHARVPAEEALRRLARARIRVQDEVHAEVRAHFEDVEQGSRDPSDARAVVLAAVHRHEQATLARAGFARSTERRPRGREPAQSLAQPIDPGVADDDDAFRGNALGQQVPAGPGRRGVVHARRPRDPAAVPLLGEGIAPVPRSEARLHVGTGHADVLGREGAGQRAERVPLHEDPVGPVRRDPSAEATAKISLGSLEVARPRRLSRPNVAVGDDPTVLGRALEDALLLLDQDEASPEPSSRRAGGATRLEQRGELQDLGTSPGQEEEFEGAHVGVGSLIVGASRGRRGE